MQQYKLPTTDAHFVRDARETDIPLLAEWTCDDAHRLFLGSGRGLLTIEDARQDIVRAFQQGRRPVQLMLVGSQDEAIGTSWLYNIASIDGTAMVNTFLREGTRGKHLGPLLTVSAILEGFQSLRLQKVSLTIHGANTASLAALSRVIRDGFVKPEGLFENERYHEGRWWPIHRFAVFRKDEDRLRAFIGK